MLFTTRIQDSNGKLLTDETRDTFGTVEELIEGVRILTERQDYSVTIELELMPETADEIEELRQIAMIAEARA